jgi:protein phosphatase
MQRLIEAGELTPEEAEQSERRNIILQALGPEPTVKIDLTHQPVRRGDLLVLCTDGLSGQVRKDEIAQIVTDERDLEVAGQMLIDRANANGGPDNITVVLARLEGDGLPPVSAGDRVGHSVFELANATPSTPRVPLRRITAKTDAVTTPTPADNTAVATAPARPPSARGNQILLMALAAVLVIALVAFIFVHVRGAVSDASEPLTPPAQGAAPDTVASPATPDTQ